MAMPLANTLHDKCLFLSGRLGEILYKVARAGFPMIVSRSAPTFKAVEQAEQLGITVGLCPRPPLIYTATSTGWLGSRWLKIRQIHAD